MQMHTFINKCIYISMLIFSIYKLRMVMNMSFKFKIKCIYVSTYNISECIWKVLCLLKAMRILRFLYFYLRIFNLKCLRFAFLKYFFKFLNKFCMHTYIHVNIFLQQPTTTQYAHSYFNCFLYFGLQFCPNLTRPSAALCIHIDMGIFWQ